MTSKAELLTFGSSIEEESEDPFIVKLEEKLSKFQPEADYGNFDVKEFKAYTDYLNKKKENFDGVTTYDLEQRVSIMEKDILFIHLKNEVYENFLKRRQPAVSLDDAREQLTPEAKEERKKLIARIENADIQLSSEELFYKDETAKAEHDFENELISSFEGSTAHFLSKIVENEISEICAMANRSGADQEKRFNEIENHYNSLEAKSRIIEEGIAFIMDMFGPYFERRKKNAEVTVSKREVHHYLTMDMKRLDKISRFLGVQSSLIGKQIKELRNWRSGFTHITPVNMEMLEFQCIKLKDEIIKNERDLVELKVILDELNMKIAKNKELSEEYVDKIIARYERIINKSARNEVKASIG